MSSSRKRVPRVVLDVNVWVSALLWGGKPAEIVKAAEEGKVVIVASEEIVGEISQVLNYPKLRKVYQAAGLRHKDLVEAVIKVVRFVEVSKRVSVVVEHPADDKFIECVLAAGADYIVSGDRHLLKIGGYKRTRILSVSELLGILEAK
ncbi:MAG: putative toxin-antitoxin system toxin component, PIN family [Candidatus Bathyarchaeota archaeon]|nr:putative toxin-antitoxin system toxin component, PIN family [Candidatus Bathyarchaeota archaeon]